MSLAPELATKHDNQNPQSRKKKTTQYFCPLNCMWYIQDTYQHTYRFTYKQRTKLIPVIKRSLWNYWARNDLILNFLLFIKDVQWGNGNFTFDDTGIWKVETLVMRKLTNGYQTATSTDICLWGAL